MRKEGTEEWEEKARDIRITAKNYDKVKDLDPCAKYEIRVSHLDEISLNCILFDSSTKKSTVTIANDA